MPIEVQILNGQNALYALYDTINLIMTDIVYISSEGRDVEQLKLQLNEYNMQFTSSLNELQSLYDIKNVNNPHAGFPLAGERIIHVGETLTMQWDTTISNKVNLFFMKGGSKIPITILKEETDDKKSFVIDASHFSDEYLPCKIRIENTNVDSIFDESPVFKVLKSN